MANLKIVIKSRWRQLTSWFKTLPSEDFSRDFTVRTLGVVGLVMIVGVDFRTVFEGRAIGYLLCLGAIISWNIYNFMTSHLGGRYQPLTLTFNQLTCTVLLSWPLALANMPDPADITLTVVGEVLYLGIVSGGIGFVIYVAALYALPKDVLEAAEIDNCGWFRKLIFIIIPMLRPTLLNLLILSFIGKMKVFDLVWIMTKGGPLWSTETVSTYVYKRAFEWSTFDLGYPSAVAAVWFIVVLVFVLGLTWLFHQRERLEY